MCHMTACTLDPRPRVVPPRTGIVVPALALALVACAPAAAPQPSRPAPVAAAPPAAPAAPPVAPSGPAPVLKAIDVYGTDRIDVVAVRARWGDPIQRMLATEDDSERTKLQTEISDAIRAEHKLGWVKLSVITYFQPEGQQSYLTIDAVEQADMASRFRFRPVPQGSVPDPAGLIAAWKEYEATFFGLLRRSEISPKRVDCPAFHCLGGYQHEKLRPFGDRFVTDVPANEAQLIRVLQDDRAEENRGAAAFLLAHIKDGKQLVALMLPMLDDPAPLARNNAMRVLADVARHHPEIDIPLEPVLHALNGPTTTDRNKAVAIVAGLLDRPDGARRYREVIQKAGPTLLKLLALEQPNNHDFAYKIFKQVSGKDLGERDIAAWQRWLVEQP
jgi:hypothetical protein